MDGTSVLKQGSVNHAPLSPDWTIQGFGDFNGDGKRDIFWRHVGGASEVWLMDGFEVSGSDFLPFGPTLDTSWQPGGLGDFDGDGKTDVLWRGADGSMRVWLMDGPFVSSDGTFALEQVGAGWSVAGLGDFDGDGRTDLFWRHENDMLRVWLMNGIWGGSVYGPSGQLAEEAIEGFGDFNGDRKTDVFLRQTSPGAVTTVWLMDGETHQASGTGSVNPYLGSMPTSVQAVGVHDFTGDGRSDVLWMFNETVHSWQMQGPDAAPGFAYSLFQGSQLRGVGDFNGDGRSDLLHENAGSLWVVFTDGQAPVAFANLGLFAPYVVIDPIRR
jgi:hypothetical protein